MTKVVEHTKRETLTKPPGKWRNWYRALRNFPSYADVGSKKAGEIYGGVGLWPTRDIAETKAHESHSSVTRGWAAYVGAYPEGERP